MKTKKTVHKKLTDHQLKKIKGGKVKCKDTKCIGDTCGNPEWGEKSVDHCKGSKKNTIRLAFD